MEANEQQLFEAVLSGSDSIIGFGEIDDYDLQQDNHDTRSPLSWTQYDLHLTAGRTMLLNLPPSLRDAAETSRLRPGFQQEIVTPPFLEEEVDQVTASAPLSFNQRCIRLAMPQPQDHFDSMSNIQYGRTSFSSRADSAIGSWDNIPSFTEVSDLPGCWLQDSSPITSEDDTCRSRSLQYHLIQSRSGIDHGAPANNILLPRACLPGSTLPSSRYRSIENNHHSLPCPLCVNKRPFTGVYAHRNLTRHMDSVHAPCASADGIKHIRCGHLHCEKTFRREDARLVHERRSHPELNRPPPTKRKRSVDL